MPRDRRYSTARWRRLRDAVIRRDGRRCAIPDCTTDMFAPRMTHVDHIVEVRDGGDGDFWDPANLQVMCKPHHDAKSRALAADRPSGGHRGYPTPGDPRFCWLENERGWHHVNPIHGFCEWMPCPHGNTPSVARWRRDA